MSLVESKRHDGENSTDGMGLVLAGAGPDVSGATPRRADGCWQVAPGPDPGLPVAGHTVRSKRASAGPMHCHRASRPLPC